MQKRKEFTPLETLYENNTTLIQRGLHNDTPAILKKLKQAQRTEYKIKQFKNEEQILSKLNAKNIIKLLDVASQPSAYYHLLEDIGGASLYQLILEQKFSLEESL